MKSVWQTGQSKWDKLQRLAQLHQRMLKDRRAMAFQVTGLANRPIVLMDRVLLTGSTSAGTFGAAGSLIIPTWVKAILGAVVIGVDVTPTAAQGKSQILRMNIPSLGLSNQTFLTGPYITSDPATNISNSVSVAEIIKLDIRCNGGEVVTLDLDVAGASTVATKTEVGLLYCNDPERLRHEAPDWIHAFPDPVAARGGNVQNAQAIAAGATNLYGTPNTCVIPSWAKAIIGYKGVMTKTGAVTVTDYDLGYFILNNTLGLSPLNLITCLATSANLGTPAGIGGYADRIKYIPIYIPLLGKDETLTPQAYLDVAVTTDNRAALGVIYR